jgi:UDP-2,3-diacylglucosamine pyrophosphatase LpxH
MIVFLSDLHLTDELSSSTIDLPRLFEVLGDSFRRAADSGAKDLHLVLLGDIFEMLKSKIWLESNLRPWEAATSAHVAAVAEIFSRIESANRDFFEGLQGLVRSHSVTLDYLPGNHDLVLNGAMGAVARARLQTLVTLPEKEGQPFRTVFSDAEHSVLAKHGHEWDPVNRYGETTAAFGDAIVIELVLQFPTLVAASLGLDESDANLAFLHEIDNVRPQQPRAMEQWLIVGLDRLARSHPNAAKALERVLIALAEDVRALSQRSEFAGSHAAHWWTEALFRLGKLVLRRYGALRTAIRLPAGGEVSSSYRQDAFLDIQTALTTGVAYRYIVCGHTHIHELVPLAVDASSPPALYVNTGTWRRTHRAAELSSLSRVHSFSTWQEECLFCVYSPADDRCRQAYEVHRFTRGPSLKP